MKPKHILSLSLLLGLLILVGCKKYVTITVQSNNAECHVSGSGTYNKGEGVTISAIPAEGFTFVRWNDGNTLNPRYIYAERSATYVAFFETSNSSGGNNNGGSNNNSISAPTGVKAIIKTAGSDDYLYVSWNSVSNAVKYKIYYSTRNSDYSYIGYCESNQCNITNPNTDNYVKVSAVNNQGQESNLSSYAYCHYDGGGSGGGGGTTAPSAPTGVTASNVGSSSSPQVRISWSSVSGATSYKVYRSSSASGTYSQLGSSTSNTYSYDNNPLSGYNYYKVKAVNNAGESPYSSYTYFNNNGGGGGGGTTSYSPCPPTVSVSGTSSQTVSWTVSTSSGCGTPTSYKVHKYDPCSGDWELKTTTTSRSYSCPSSSVHPGINRYVVEAINSQGSAQGTGTSSEVSLSTPTSFSARKSGDYVVFSWNAVSKATGYQIFESSSASGTYVLCDQVNSGSTTSLTKYYPASSGTTRYFKIKAVYSCGYIIVYSNLSSYKSVTF